MSVSTIYYRIKGAKTLEDYEDLNTAVNQAKQTEVDMETFYWDISVMLCNTVEVDDLDGEMEHRLFYGHPLGNEYSVDCGSVGGFVPPEEVQLLYNWITQEKLDTMDGFANRYDALDEAVQEALDDWGSPDQEEMFDLFQPLVNLYKTAAANGEAIIICTR